MRTRTRLAALIVVVGATLAACGSDSKTVETNDGKVTVDGDGKNAKVTIEGENGASATFGTQKVPKDFPADVPRPEGHKLQSAISSEQDGKQSFQLVYTLEGASPKDAIADYRDQLESRDYTVEESGSIGAAGAALGGFAASNGEQKIVVTSIGTDKDGGVLSVSVTEA